MTDYGWEADAESWLENYTVEETKRNIAYYADNDLDLPHTY